MRPGARRIAAWRCFRRAPRGRVVSDVVSCACGMSRTSALRHKVVLACPAPGPAVARAGQGSAQARTEGREGTRESTGGAPRDDAPRTRRGNLHRTRRCRGGREPSAGGADAARRVARWPGQAAIERVAFSAAATIRAGDIRMQRHTLAPHERRGDSQHDSRQRQDARERRALSDRRRRGGRSERPEMAKLDAFLELANTEARLAQVADE